MALSAVAAAVAERDALAAAERETAVAFGILIF
jgi:hypothetical protein